MASFKRRLNISDTVGSDTLQFFSKDGNLLSTGYVRVVIGKRGPYVEFNKDQIQWDSFFVPDVEKYRWNDNRAYYVEHRSKCNSNVKLYLQKRTVAYADYKIGMCYISPFDLVVANFSPVIFGSKG